MLRRVKRQARGEIPTGTKIHPTKWNLEKERPVGKPIKADTAERDVKLLNAMRSAKIKDFETKNKDKVINYLKGICPDMDFSKGGFVNGIRKNKGRRG